MGREDEAGRETSRANKGRGRRAQAAPSQCRGAPCPVASRVGCCCARCTGERTGEQENRGRLRAKPRGPANTLESGFQASLTRLHSLCGRNKPTLPHTRQASTTPAAPTPQASLADKQPQHLSFQSLPGKGRDGLALIRHHQVTGSFCLSGSGSGSSPLPIFQFARAQGQHKPC